MSNSSLDKLTEGIAKIIKVTSDSLLIDKWNDKNFLDSGGIESHFQEPDLEEYVYVAEEVLRYIHKKYKLIDRNSELSKMVDDINS